MLKDNLVDFLIKNNYDYLLVNSTNEFLVEYNEIEANARFHLTGFSGSTGEALLNKSGEVYLFVDGRYHKQADNQAFSYVNVVKMGLGETFLASVADKIKDNSKIAIVPNKISLNFFKNLSKTLSQKNVEIIELAKDVVFDHVQPKTQKTAQIINIPEKITGLSSKDKITNIQFDLGDDESLLVTNLEQIAWLLNKRSFSQNFSSSFKAKMIIEKNDYKVFFADEQEQFYNYLKSSKNMFLYVPKNISYGDYLYIKDNSKALETDKIELAKSIKNENELKHLQECFKKTDKVVTTISDYVNMATSLTEQELVKLVEQEFFKQGATSLSFNTILASGKNSALAHYSTDMSENTVINDGDFVLLDCGAYFEGGYATDITRVFCFGNPSELAKRVYTIVLKANLNAYHIPITKGVTGFDIDKKARDIINSSNLVGFSFNHSTGHGVGISVHEFPPSVSPSELGKTELKDGMVFTIEPGAYNPDFGGVRLENTVFLKDGHINSFSKVKFEEKLINYDLLNEQEKEWLNLWQSEAL